MHMRFFNVEDFLMLAERFGANCSELSSDTFSIRQKLGSIDLQPPKHSAFYPFFNFCIIQHRSLMAPACL
jgi:hypothetical protein